MVATFNQRINIAEHLVLVILDRLLDDTYVAFSSTFTAVTVL